MVQGLKPTDPLGFLSLRRDVLDYLQQVKARVREDDKGRQSEAFPKTHGIKPDGAGHKEAHHRPMRNDGQVACRMSFQHVGDCPGESLVGLVRRLSAKDQDVGVLEQTNHQGLELLFAAPKADVGPEVFVQVRGGFEGDAQSVSYDLAGLLGLGFPAGDNLGEGVGNHALGQGEASLASRLGEMPLTSRHLGNDLWRRVSDKDQEAFCSERGGCP
jgi:hypothetical protein